MGKLYRPLEPPVPLREQVYATLEELILDGRLQPGQRLVETELASELGVSRGPVREALQLLARDGWLDVHPRQGTYVRELLWQELENYFWVRGLLEVEAARLAARRVREDRQARSADLTQLRDMLSRSAKLSVELPDDRDPGTLDDPEEFEIQRQYRRSSREFHYTLARVSGNEALAELLEYLGKRTRWYFSSAQFDRREARRQEHEQLVEAIEDGDEERAGDLMRHHMDALRTWSREAFSDG